MYGGKLIKDNSYRIIQYNRSGNVLNIFETLDDACSKTGLKRNVLLGYTRYSEEYPIKGSVWRKEGQPFVLPRPDATNHK